MLGNKHLVWQKNINFLTHSMNGRSWLSSPSQVSDVSTGRTHFILQNLAVQVTRYSTQVDECGLSTVHTEQLHRKENVTRANVGPGPENGDDRLRTICYGSGEL
jgi:hypothetical protein